ncbi:MAG: carboxypeptidase-like regulatory domain-containing protein [Bacteroidota bacterium]|jgi:CarboxypepD_reg-like domain
MIHCRPTFRYAFLTGIFLILEFHGFNAVAQITNGISGRVTDAVNGSPLPFAQMAISNSTNGTVTNDDGQFFLVIPEGRLKDTLVVSYLGYETVKLALGGIAGKTTEISLKPKEVSLKEVEVVALTPEEVMRRMFNNIPLNYGKDSLLLTAFYRSQKFTGKKLAEYSEAIIVDLKTGYFHQNSMRDVKFTAGQSNKTQLVKGRVVSDTNLVNAMGEVGKMAGCLGCIFAEDMVENNFRTMFDEEVFRFYTYKMEELANPDGGKIYHIRFDQANNKIKGFKGEIFIDGNSYALMKIRLRPSFQGFEAFEKDKGERSYTINQVSGWIAELPLFDKTMIYSKRNGGWYLNTIHDEQWITFTLPSTGKKIMIGYKNDLVVTDVNREPEKVRSFKGDKTAGVARRWDQLAGPADEEFWAHFNYLPVEESLKKAIGNIKSEKRNGEMAK